jgi:hypothetical protein
MTMPPGTTTERAIKYAMDSCARRERDVVVWRRDRDVGASATCPPDAKLIGTARFAGRAPLWEPAA